jgi:predicted branched-subunit amino acid permease
VPVDQTTEQPLPAAERRRVLSGSLAFGLIGLYGLSFGAVATANGFDLAQAATLSLLTFTGGSQFALVGILGTGGSGLAGTVAALLVGARNGLYGLRLAPVLQVGGVRRLAAAHLVIDETTAMTVAEADPRAGRLSFWATGATLFLTWNLTTLIGALGAELVDPATIGLDAVAGAAFLALLWPHLATIAGRLAALTGATVVVLGVGVLPPGLPVLLGGVIGIAVGASALRERP